MHVHPWRPIGFFVMCSACACSASTEPGAEVRVVSLPSAVSPPLEVTSSAGVNVRVDASSWTYSSVELLPCPSLSRRVLDALVPAAHAHGASSPTKLAAPSVQTLATREAVALGVLRPPATRYCGVEVTLGPADDDADGLADNPAMLRKTFEVRGAFGDGSANRDFASTTSALARAMVPLDLDLEAGERRVTLAIERELESWFVEVDAEALADPALAETVLDNFARSTRVRAE